MAFWVNNWACDCKVRLCEAKTELPLSKDLNSCSMGTEARAVHRSGYMCLLTSSVYGIKIVPKCPHYCLVFSVEFVCVSGNSAGCLVFSCCYLNI